MPSVGIPRDGAPWVALALGIVAFFAAPALVKAWRRPRLVLAGLALAAAMLSAAYIPIYLRGGPRIIDASSYWLEARGLAGGLLSWPLDEPETAVLGRFLVRSEHDGVPHAAVIFPPGYPAALALGFLARAPLAVGPILGALLVLATYALARRLTRDQGVAQVAACLSVVCGALRYHTADTMSHGLAALLFAASLVLLLRAFEAAKGEAVVAAIAAGLAGGWLVATRPFTSVALVVTTAYLFARDPRARAHLAVPMLLGAIPGLALLALHQHAATGVWFASSQRAYYAVSDGPADCFRYGFGAGIGCLGEHGDFVQARLADGFSGFAPLLTTLRRLWMHTGDAGNVELFAPLVMFGAFVARGSARGRAASVAILAQILVYAPFYFDGNYPAGGARFFAELLPIEHVLVAAAAASLASRSSKAVAWAGRPVAFALLGFAFRGGFEHAKLRDRDGGRPFFEPEVLARAGVREGLVFFDSDHGFDLAFDPTGASRIHAARLHGDALDRATWEALGHPPAYRYRCDVPEDESAATIGVEAIRFDAAPGPTVIEGESLWPPVAQAGGYALPEWVAGTGASADRWLAIRRVDPSREARVTVALPSALVAGKELRVRLGIQGPAHGAVVLGEARVSFEHDAEGTDVLEIGPVRPAAAGATRPRLTIEVAPASQGVVGLDAITVGP